MQHEDRVAGASPYTEESETCTAPGGSRRQVRGSGTQARYASWRVESFLIEKYHACSIGLNSRKSIHPLSSPSGSYGYEFGGIETLWRLTEPEALAVDALNCSEKYCGLT